MFDFDVVTGPSPAERAALERARSDGTRTAALPEGGRPAEPAARGSTGGETAKPA